MPTPVNSTTADPARAAAGEARAWGWVAHLGQGGTTPWIAWREPGVPTAGWLPGAQQLELLRRLNAIETPDPALSARVLAATAVGRGRHDIALPGVEPTAAFGPGPVDPADLGDDELLRVAADLLARTLTDSCAVSPGKPGGAGQTNRAPRWVRRRYRLVGDPELTAPLTAALVADGRPPGGRGAAVLVLGTDVATMLGHAWTTGAFAEGGAPWAAYVEEWRARDALPRRVDLVAIADRWRRDRATGSLTVVLDPTAVPGRVGVPRSHLPGPAAVPAAAAELARRTAIALGLLVAPAERDRLLAERLRPRLAAHTGPAPVVPEPHRAWVEALADRTVRRLRAARHAVGGDPDTLRPRWPDERPPSAPSPLDLALRLLLAGTA